MKWKEIVCRLWLSIIATNAVSWNMILFSIRLRTKFWSEALDNKLNTTTDHNSKPEKNLSVHSLEAAFDEETAVSQLEKIRKKNIIRVAIIGRKAYWVHENIFYETNIINGSIDNDGAKAIDAYSLSDRELSRLLKILDNIS